MTFYQQYQVLWPELCVTADMPGERMAGYRQNTQKRHSRKYESMGGIMTVSLVLLIESFLHVLCVYILVLGKVEGKGENWHGHVTAVTVAPEYRRLGLAQLLMDYLERLSDQAYQGYFVDLYVRKGNQLAVDMYKQLGYIVYRQVIGYYSGEEDAYDMHKALPRDREKKSMIGLPHPVHPGEQDMW